MIYIINKNYQETSGVVAVYDLPKNAKTLYYRFIYNKANEIGIMVHPTWLNIMNREDWHQGMSYEDYKTKEIVWNEFLKNNSFLMWCGKNYPKKKMKFIIENVG